MPFINFFLINAKVFFVVITTIFNIIYLLNRGWRQKRGGPAKTRIDCQILNV